MKVGFSGQCAALGEDQVTVAIDIQVILILPIPDIPAVFLQIRAAGNHLAELDIGLAVFVQILHRAAGADALFVEAVFCCAFHGQIAVGANEIMGVFIDVAAALGDGMILAGLDDHMLRTCSKKSTLIRNWGIVLPIHHAHACGDFGVMIECLAVLLTGAFRLHDAAADDEPGIDAKVQARGLDAAAGDDELDSFVASNSGSIGIVGNELTHLIVILRLGIHRQPGIIRQRQCACRIEAAAIRQHQVDNTGDGAGVVHSSFHHIPAVGDIAIRCDLLAELGGLIPAFIQELHRAAGAEAIVIECVLLLPLAADAAVLAADAMIAAVDVLRSLAESMTRAGLQLQICGSAEGARPFADVDRGIAAVAIFDGELHAAAQSGNYVKSLAVAVALQLQNAAVDGQSVGINRTFRAGDRKLAHVLPRLLPDSHRTVISRNIGKLPAAAVFQDQVDCALCQNRIHSFSAINQVPAGTQLDCSIFIRL